MKEYKILIREIPKDWDVARILETDVAECTLEVEDLYPTSTYQFKIQGLKEDGSWTELSPAATIDTAVANCGPDGKKKRCVVM